MVIVALILVAMVAADPARSMDVAVNAFAANPREATLAQTRSASRPLREPASLVVVYHIGTVGQWRQIVQEQIEALQASSIWFRIARVYVGANGPEAAGIPDLAAQWGLPVTMLTLEASQPFYENTTINDLQKLSKGLHEDTYVLYLHSKGVTATSQQQADWRRYMMGAVVDNAELCIDLLNRGYETVGPCLLHSESFLNRGYHRGHYYSGNFWWSTANHLKLLKPIGNVRDRYQAEWWVLSLIDTGRHVGLGRRWFPAPVEPFVSFFKDPCDVSTLTII